MKARIISYSEIKEMFQEILVALEQKPLDEQYILDRGAQLIFTLGICISQMKSADSAHYPKKSVHLAMLEQAKRAITYKINTCTIEEISGQVTSAYKAFGVQ